MKFDPFDREKSVAIRDYALSLFLVVMAFVFFVGAFYTIHAVSPVLKRFEPSVTSASANDLGAKENHLIHVKVYLTVKYRDGNLLYRGYIEPIDGKSFKYLTCELSQEDTFSSSSHYIALNLRDKDGFKITTIYLTKDKLSTTVDDNNQPVYYSFEGSKSIYLGVYEDINRYDITWNLNEDCKGVR